VPLNAPPPSVILPIQTCLLESAIELPIRTLPSYSISFTYPTQANATAIINNSQSFNLERNGTLVDSGTGTLQELITLGAGVYNYTAYYTATQNYSACSETSYLTVNLGTLNVTIISPANGTSYYRGSDVTLNATIQDQNGNTVTDATVQWYNSTSNINTGETGSWTVPIAHAISSENITCNATSANYTTGSDSVIINILNNLPFVGTPTYNVTPAEVYQGDDIRISCTVNDTENSADQLSVNISILDPNNVWSNTTADGHIGDTFYRDYDTTESSPIGTYTAVCTAIDLDSGFKEGSTSTFVVYVNGTITINLNATTVWWNEGLHISGQAKRGTGDPIASSDVDITVGSSTVCSGTSTNINGAYSCDFLAPGAIGDYTVTVQTSDPDTGKSITNSTSLYVEATYGDTSTEQEQAENVGCYEVPQIIQNPDGSIKKVIVRVCVWK